MSHPINPAYLAEGKKIADQLIQRAEYLRRSAAARECLTPPRAKDWEGDALTDVLMAVDLVANTVMDEAKKNPVQQRDAFLWAPAMNSYLFGQSMHDVGQAVVDKLIGAGWVPPSRMSASKNTAPARGWPWVLGVCALLLAVAALGMWVGR